MTRILISLLFFLTTTIFVHAQLVVDGVNVNDLKDVKLVQVVGYGKLFSNKVKIVVDYGQEIKWLKIKGTFVTDKNGAKKIFNSMIDAMNHLENNGWEYLDAYAVSIDAGMGGNSTVYHYTFKRRE